MIKTIQNEWLKVFCDELQHTQLVRIVSPFIKENMVTHLLSKFNGTNIQLITRYNLNDFRSGVSSLKALEQLLSSGVEIKGIKGLHSKLYLFDSKSVIITSANFTSGGFFNNKEFGVITDDMGVINDAQSYFDNLWQIDKNLLVRSKLNEWSKTIENSRNGNSHPNNDLSDHGASRTEQLIQNRRYFIKFFGRGNDRANMSALVEDTIRYGVSHYALSFSRTSNDRRPIRYRDGDIVFMARMSHHIKNDYSIFARGVAIAHDRIRDIAGPDDIAHINWIEDWPILVRVRDVQFINGTLADCPRMNDLTNDLDYESFEPTLRNYLKGSGNISPKSALQQKSDIRLSDSGAIWMEDRFERALNSCGTIPQKFINQFYSGLSI